LSVFGIGPAELILIFVLALIFIGPGKMPEVAASVGKALREFQKASAELTEALSAEVAAVQAAKDAALNGNQVADIADAEIVAAPASDTSETSVYDSIKIEPVVTEPVAITPTEAESAASTAAEVATSSAETVVSSVFPPIVDPNGTAPLPTSLLAPSESMRALFIAAQARAARLATAAEPSASLTPPAADPTGLAPLPSALLDPADSMRGLTANRAAAPAASANQTEA
jgi:TatA/E family protein of Tat protein translocase